MPPTAEPTMGSPCAIASSAANGRPSDREGCTKTSAAARKSTRPRGSRRNGPGLAIGPPRSRAGCVPAHRRRRAGRPAP
jgi:hypothetical protein